MCAGGSPPPPAAPQRAGTQRDAPRAELCGITRPPPGWGRTDPTAGNSLLMSMNANTMIFMILGASIVMVRDFCLFPSPPQSLPAPSLSPCTSVCMRACACVCVPH